MRRHQSERGAVLPMFVISLTVLLAMSAFAVDLGVLFTERRQAQSSADSGALGGALDLPSGMNAASEATAQLVRANLSTDYTDIEWSALWAACSDPGALKFTGEVLGTGTNCISFDGLGKYRVVLPDQEIEAIFANVVGKDTFSTSAFAEVELTVLGVGGVLPFAVLGSAPSGTEICMRSSTNGTATPPCTGSDSGNFGALQVAQWGNPAYGTELLTCNLNKSDQLLVNLSVGIDHFITPYTGSEVLDTCAKPFGPNTLSTFQGISGGLFEGLVVGDYVQGVGFPGRLTRGGASAQTVSYKGISYQLDNTPLWAYIGYGKAGSVPPSCTRETFDAAVAGGGAAAGEAQITVCFADYQSGVGFAALFDIDTNDDDIPDIVGSSRYGAVPQFYETSFPSGGSSNLHVSGFRAVYLNGLYFGCNGTSCAISYTPGSVSGVLNLPNGGSPLDQVSGYLLPNSTLPPELVENGVGGSLGAFQVRLSR
jgi:Putative Flp pilus-assembly TadE/G-like